MVVVRQERDRYAIVLYGLVNGHISDDAYEELVSNYPLSSIQLRSRPFRERLLGSRLPFEDSFVLYMHLTCIQFLIEDLRTVFFKGSDTLAPNLQNLFERAILFLETDQEFEWALEESELIWNNANDFRRTNPSVVEIITACLPIARTRSHPNSPANEEANQKSGADWWPFKSASSYEAASKEREERVQRLQQE